MRVLLEPFLLDGLTPSSTCMRLYESCLLDTAPDALNSHSVGSTGCRKQSGRETPHNNMSDAKVELLCFLDVLDACEDSHLGLEHQWGRTDGFLEGKRIFDQLGQTGNFQGDPFMCLTGFGCLNWHAGLGMEGKR